MRLIISCLPAFLISSKKKHRGDATTSSFCSSDDQTITPVSVLSPKPRRRRSSDQGEMRNHVTRRELEVVLRQLRPRPPTEEELAEMLQEADPRGHGHFSVDHIAALGLEETAGPASPELMRDTFVVFDGDGDGKISAEELLGLFAAVGDDRCSLQDCRRMIAEVDTDGDGYVCFHDFQRMMRGGR